MPKDPKGRKRPADVIANAVHVMRIATSEITETTPSEGHEVRRARASAGGAARSNKLTPGKRRAIAKKAARARWNRS